MSRVGLVSTFRFAPSDRGGEAAENGTSTADRCWSVLSSFLLFHLAKGVDHIFLYADADDEWNRVYVDRIAKEFLPSQVSVDVRSEAQEERQRRTCRLWRELRAFSATEVPARQSLNAEDALSKAGAMGLDWLLHLDIDELFYTAESSIKPHFDHLNRLGVEQMTYANHEAVPTGEVVGDYFSEVHLFRVNHLMLPLSREVAECTRFWRRRRQHGQYMLAYDNGKSAVRVLPGRIVPQSVHRWRTLRSDERDRCYESESSSSTHDTTEEISEGSESHTRRALEMGTANEERVPVQNHSDTGGVGIYLPGDGSTGRREKDAAHDGEGGDGARGDDRHEEKGRPDVPLINRSALVDPRQLRFNDLLECSDPCVLHYPSCGLEWLRDKYRLLGSFPSSWFGGKLPIAPCFHLDARNALERRSDLTEQSNLTERPNRPGPPVAGGAYQGDSDPPVGNYSDAERDDDAGRDLYRREVMLCPDEHAEQIRVQLEHGVLRTITGAASVIKQVGCERAKLDSAGGPSKVPTLMELEQHSATSAANAAEIDKLKGVEGQSNGSSLTSNSSDTNVQNGGAGGIEGGSMRWSSDDVVDPSPAVASVSSFDNSWILSAAAREFL